MKNGSGNLLAVICLLNPRRGTGVINLNLLFTIRLVQGKTPLANFTQPSLSGVLVLNHFVFIGGCNPISSFGYFRFIYIALSNDKPHIRASR